jgi:RNA polymerase sigma factor (sigma-70 family)
MTDDVHRFTQAFDAHFPAVLAYAVRRCASRESAEDVAVETFLVAWRNIDVLPAEPLPWLYAVARHQALNAARGERRRAALLQLLGAQALAGLGQLEDVSVSEPAPDPQLDGALERLPAAEREALTLVAWEGLTHQQAADSLGVSRFALARTLRRAGRHLAGYLDPPGSHMERNEIQEGTRG